MSMNTEFFFIAQLGKSNQMVLQILRHMLGERDQPPGPLPEHDLFQTQYWRDILRANNRVGGDLVSTMQGGWLSIYSYSKNYGNEIEKFLDWIGPYLYHGEGDFLGFLRDECMLEEEWLKDKRGKPRIIHMGGTKPAISRIEWRD